MNTILDISPSDYLQQYIYYTTLLKNENSTVLVGVDKAMVNMITNKYGMWWWSWENNIDNYVNKL